MRHFPDIFCFALVNDGTCCPLRLSKRLSFATNLQVAVRMPFGVGACILSVDHGLACHCRWAARPKYRYGEANDAIRLPPDFHNVLAYLPTTQRKTMTATTATIVTPTNSRDLDGEYDTVDWLSKLESGAVLNSSDCEKILQDKVRNMQTPSQMLAYCSVENNRNRAICASIMPAGTLTYYFSLFLRTAFP